MKTESTLLVDPQVEPSSHLVHFCIFARKSNYPSSSHLASVASLLKPALHRPNANDGWVAVLIQIIPDVGVGQSPHIPLSLLHSD